MENKWLSYTDISKQLKVVIYADFECFFKTKIDTCTPNPSHSYTEKLTRHVPTGFTYKLVALYDDLSRDPVVFCGENVADMFIQHILKIQDRLDLVYRNPKPLHMTMEERSEFRSVEHCHIGQGVLGDDRVRDHCHVTGTFRGAAHNECNVNFRLRNRIPVIFHNLRGYDAYLIIQAIGKADKDIKCIPNNMEKYVSFSMGSMDFIDSLQFLPAPVGKLVSNLKEFKHIQACFTETLLLRKGVYPYDYVDSPDKLPETQLPPLLAFDNVLTGESITDEDYTHAKQVWENLTWFLLKNTTISTFYLIHYNWRCV